MKRYSTSFYIFTKITLLKRAKLNIYFIIIKIKYTIVIRLNTITNSIKVLLIIIICYSYKSIKGNTKYLGINYRSNNRA